MKIGFLVPREIFYEKIKEVMEASFIQHKADFLLYDNYTDAPELLKDRQTNFDAIIFGGVAPMEYAGERLPQQTIWSAISKSSSSLLRAMMEARQKGWNLARISYDSYSRSFLKEVYDEIRFNGGVDFECLTTGIISHESSRNESCFEFHSRRYEEGKTDGCITVLYRVHKMLMEKRIPCVLAFPTKNSIRQQVEFVTQLHSARKLNSGSIAVGLINVDLPAEYSAALQSEYQFMVERTNILKQIYRFSEQLQGTVVELSPREFMILSTREIMEIATEEYSSWDIFSWIKNNSFQTVSIGVGYGKTVAAAKKNAGKAIIRSLKHKKNSAYVVEDDGKVVGPCFGKTENPESANGADLPPVDEKLLKISDKCKLSVNTIQKIYFFVHCLKNRQFYPDELAAYLNISRRSADRILEKLEENGYAFVAGRRMINPRGRPVRVMQIFFDAD